MKKLAKGISNYKKLIENGYYYVDKTGYIEKLENLADTSIMMLRPRKFGKTLFTSTLENYYDILKKDEFEKLYGNTYIGKNPTPLKNKYHILKFNFSGIDTNTAEATIRGFKAKTMASIQLFVNKYKMDYYVNEEMEAEELLDNLFKAFQLQKPKEEIYVIIDEYDHFANELLGFKTEDFKNLMVRNGKVRKWYEILKEGTEKVVDRIFITGVAPITLDSLTSGFNVSKDLTRDPRFNEMLGFTEEELIEVMNSQNLSEELKKSLLPIMRENYDGYKFSLNAEKEIYNSNMCLNFLDDYIGLGKMPRSMVDVNIVSDYKKLGNMLSLCQGEQREQIIEKTVSGEEIISYITDKFNPEKEFEEQDLISMLYYLGYLTIAGEELGKPSLKIPNKVMREIYSDYFMQVLSQKTDLTVGESEYNEILQDIAINGKIDKIVELTQKYLKNLSNRDAIKFDEKYVKLIFFCISMNLKSVFWVKSEMEVQRKYPDILLIPKDKAKGYKGAMIELKYLKKEDSNKLKEKQKEAKEQIKEYAEFEEIKEIENMNYFTVVAVNDEIYVEQLNQN